MSCLLIVIIFLIAFQNQDDHDNKENFEEVEEHNTFSRRKLEPNWARYEESEKEEINEDVPTQRGTDYHVLLTSAGKTYCPLKSVLYFPRASDTAHAGRRSKLSN